ncbi:MAG: hypothetical protein K2K43_08260, partial [Alistipes sp.]|nr:hypothetical protein [Alistipes sp.]
SDANLLEYKYTNSGTYHVMPIALGATAKVDIGPTGTATANTLKTYGLLYQWGRKDPLGRSGALAANTLMTTYAGATGTTVYTLNDKLTNIVTLLGGEEIFEKDGQKTGEYMIDYVTKNPTQFIVVPSGKYKVDWYGFIQCDFLWGNPQGVEYPRNSTLQQSIFDPCPKGYCVAPRDLWIAFTDNGNTRTVGVTEETWAENILNVLNIDKTTHKTTMATQRGYFLSYGVNDDGLKIWQQEPADFYPTSGLRSNTNGSLVNVGTGSWCWSSSPAGTSAGYFRFDSSSVSPLHSDGRSYGFTVRCVKEH